MQQQQAGKRFKTGTKRRRPEDMSAGSSAKRFMEGTGAMPLEFVASPSRVLGSPAGGASVPDPVSYLNTLFRSCEPGKKLLVKAPLPYTFQRPSQEELDSYDLSTQRAIRDGNLIVLRNFLENGKCFDACNQFGESLIHMACRRSDLATVKFLVVEAKVRLDVRDDFGRTPLHDACWTTEPNFEIMEVLIQSASPDLLMAEDVRGHSPFHYARKEHWPRWVKFLQEKRELILQRLSNFETFQTKKSPFGQVVA